ncbi:hypothetical protein SDJN03_20160, partial [Cucurbita argyrosperma subsp. sororia]
MMMSSKSLRLMKNGKSKKKVRKLHSSGKTTGMTMMSMTTSPCSFGENWRATPRRNEKIFLLSYQIIGKSSKPLAPKKTVCSFVAVVIVVVVTDHESIEIINIVMESFQIDVRNVVGMSKMTAALPLNFNFLPAAPGGIILTGCHSNQGNFWKSSRSSANGANGCLQKPRIDATNMEDMAAIGQQSACFPF